MTNTRLCIHIEVDVDDDGNAVTGLSLACEGNTIQKRFDVDFTDGGSSDALNGFEQLYDMALRWLLADAINRLPSHHVRAWRKK